MKNTLITIFTLLITVSISYSQSVNVPLYSDVYPFLSRLAQKGVIEFDDEIKPVSRDYVFQKLMEVKSIIEKSTNKKRITSLEREELKFFLKDYFLEAQNSFPHTTSFANIHPFIPSDSSGYSSSKSSANIHPNDTLTWLKDSFGRYRFFSYSSNLFKVNVDPILGYETGKKEGESYSHLWNGARLYGYVSNWLGFSFDFRDNSVDGKNSDKHASFTPETGWVVSRTKPEHFEYEHTNTNISANWSWGTVSIGKTPLVWGYGESGNLVHSTRAPSYPMFRVDLTLAPWLRFNYFHGWLSSDVADSVNSYSTIRSGQDRIVLRNKYIASHTIILNPYAGVSVSFGESVIYSDKLEPLYLFPLMFFRSADHYLSNGLGRNNSGSNSQFFLGVSSRNNIPNTHLYGTFFIDEVTVGDIFNHEKQRTQYAFQIGGSVVDLPIDNLTATVEYTKIYPFVYRHYIPTQTYENHGFILGDWMGHNSDRIYASLNYRIIRELQAKAWGEYIRKGGDGVIDDQYTVPQPPFLFGLRTYYSRWGVSVKYEVFHDLFIRARYNNFLTSKEVSEGHFLDNNSQEFFLAVYYGM